MKLAAKIIFLFTVAVVGIMAMSSQFISTQFNSSIENEHREVAALLAMLESRPEFELAIETKDLLFVYEQTKTVCDYTTSFRFVSFEATTTTTKVHKPLHPHVKTDMQSGSVRSGLKTPRGKDGRRQMCSYYPIASTTQTDAIEIVSSLEEADSLVSETWKKSIIAIGAIGLVSIGLAILVGIRWIGRPLKALAEKSHRVGQGDFDGDLEIHSNDELGQMATEINKMCQQLRHQADEIEHETNQRIDAIEQLRHADRLRTVGQLAAGFAHEVGTPLNVVSGRASMLLDNATMGPDKIKENARAIKTESERISSIVQKLLDFSRQSESRKTEGDLRDVINHAVELMYSMATKRNIEIRVSLPQQPVILDFDFNQIQQVLMNLIDNAVDASNQGSSIVVNLQPGQSNNSWVLEVVDQGHGINVDHLDEIFQPFFTTKETGSGTGLGLSIVHGIINEHGGRIRIKSQPDQGTSFCIELPGS